MVDVSDDQTPWMPAWLALIRTHARLWDQVETRMRQDSGLTMPRYDVLMQLENAGGRLGLSDLAEAVVLSASGLSKLLDRMAEAGLVSREPDPVDARSTYAAITPQGRSVVRRARRRHHDFLQATFGDALAERDAAHLVRIMARVDARSREV